MVGSLKRPCTTSGRSSMKTIVLNCLAFEKIAFSHFGDRQTKGQTDKQMDIAIALSRSCCHELRLNKMQFSFAFCWRKCITTVKYITAAIPQDFFHSRESPATLQPHAREPCTIMFHPRGIFEDSAGFQSSPSRTGLYCSLCTKAKTKTNNRISRQRQKSTIGEKARVTHGRRCWRWA